MSLRNKLLLWAGGSLVIVFGVNAIVVELRTRAITQEESKMNTVVLARTIADSVRSFGQIGNMEGLGYFIEDLNNLEGLQAVHIARGPGTEADYGMREGAEPTGEELAVIQSREPFEKYDPAQQTRQFIFPSLNEERCTFCHSSAKEGDVLGITNVTLSTARTDGALNRLNWTLRALFGLAILLECVLLAFVLRHLVTKPLSAIVLMLKDISQGEGDLTQRITYVSHDELGELARWFNDFIGKLQSTIRTVIERAHAVSSGSGGILETAKHVSADAVAMADRSNAAARASHQAQSSIKSMASGVEQVNGNAGTVADLAETVSSSLTSIGAATEEMSANMKVISESTDGVRDAVNAVAAAIEEMSASLGEVSRSTANAAQLTGRASETATAGASAMGAVGKSAREIGQVVEIINGLAAQTNLLALNATIEAATAGEAGKGFAVVANEVKQLAVATSNATADIQKQIEALQGNSERAVGAVDAIVGIIQDIDAISTSIAASVEEQAATTNEIGKNMGGAAESTGQVSVAVGDASCGANEISESIQRAAEGIREISQRAADLAESATAMARDASEADAETSGVATSVADVDGLVKTTADNAAGVQEAIHDLAELASELQAIVGQFKVEVSHTR